MAKYVVQTEDNVIYILDQRDGREFIQRVSPKAENTEFVVRIFTTDKKAFADAEKMIGAALKNIRSYRPAQSLEKGAFILHSGGCTARIRADQRVLVVDQ